MRRILLSDLMRNPWLALSNRVRRHRYRKPMHIIVEVRGGYPERTPRQRRPWPLSLLPWPPLPPSVESFDQLLQQLSADPHVRSVVLLISGLTAGLATIESLRNSVAHLRRSGKQAVAYLHNISLPAYYLAAACDQILAPESASFQATGLRSETIFLKDTLALAGIEADFEAIAEYKVTPDTYRRSEMTGPHREMIESLLDSLYETYTASVAEGRGLSVETIKALLDQAPMTADEALASGLLDGICYEDELAARLGTPKEPALLLDWSRAARRLLRPVRWHSRQRIGIISIQGTILSGTSRQFPLPLPLPVPGRQAGSDTIVQQLRAASQDQQLAAVILYIDSPGGSAFASDLIWREVSRLRTAKPVVAFLGEQATSGGYYVASAANAIHAQPATITGSIGIWSGKIVTEGLFSRLQAGREVVYRGKGATMYGDSAPFSDRERAKLRADIGAGYARFRRRVSEGRGLAEADVEAIARGRVWTGAQAQHHRLVDHLGDLQEAANHARRLADIPESRYAPLQDIPAPRRYQPPLPWPAGTAEWVAGLASLFRDGNLAMAPWSLRILG